MSNQDRLLSDEELEQKAIDLLDLYAIALTPLSLDKQKKATKRIIDLINTQKRLYAESIIGEDIPLHGSEENMGMIAAVNGKLAQQRKLINGDKL